MEDEKQRWRKRKLMDDMRGVDTPLKGWFPPR